MSPIDYYYDQYYKYPLRILNIEFHIVIMNVSPCRQTKNNTLEYIRGYDKEGEEKLWIVTSGAVTSMAVFDINNDNKNEVN